MKFSELNLNKQLAYAIEQKGFKEPSDIQVKAIPLILQGEDVMAQSRTGTGKTAAFSIPLLESIDPKKGHVQALILVPTRELAVQVTKELNSLAKGQRLFCLSIFGGQSINLQNNMLRKGQHILVATPGRLMDLMRRGWVSLHNIKTAVLDEADKMFDMGFREDIDYILSECPNERQTLLFSATLTDDIKSLSKKHLRADRVFVNVSQDKVAVDEINQYFIRVDPKKRISTLSNLIRSRDIKKCLVFCRTQKTADWLSKQLYSRKINARSLHGGLRQNVRQRILQNFKDGRNPILIATNLAARGIHIDDISHVINFDFPQDQETYVHRIGRTARFGRKGEAITFCTNVFEIEELERIQSHVNSSINELPEVQ